MKKIFTASLLAAAVAMSFSASAVTIGSTTITQLSQEGVAQGVTTGVIPLEFDVTVQAEHPAGSTITLTFDDKVDLGAIAVAGGVVTQSPAGGKGAAGDLGFDYGTGSFTFDNVVVDTVAGTIMFDVNLGNPLTANSAFRVTIGAHGYGTLTGDPLGDGNDVVDLSGATSVTYASETAGAVAIEAGTGVVAEEVSQFAFSVPTKFDQLIDRTVLTQFADTTVADQLQYTINNNEALEASLSIVSGFVVLDGTFTGLVSVANAAGTNDFATGSFADPGNPVVSAGFDELTMALIVAEIGAVGADVTEDIDFALVTAATDIPETGAITASLLLTPSNGGAAEFTVASNIAAGEWALDSSIVNVPYLPVGFGLTPNVEIANEMATNSDIQIRGFDQNGVVYPLTMLPFQANANTVTKVSEADIETAFGLAADSKTKLSVTFVIDADADKISVAPYYRQNESRINVLSDQYKGI
ncbi:hypothetical protein HQQ94_15930 [Shewanella sp. VB17]|uniref:hypothetical protein n=1 Tax=Shewanella sp. VB17 TaxID=2739432 RepID=UPI0015650478|nr:hypothetical protein [Shewanella sp. VB17]NRD74683.1 hypothetical protein [Shewanella sp. VB17]